MQKVLKARSKGLVKVFNPKPLCGLLRCSECGCMITAEAKTKHQKNGITRHYLYYHCTKRKQKCFQPGIRSEDLEQQLSELLKDFAMPEQWHKEWLELIAKDEEESAETTLSLVQTLRLKIAGIDKKLERLREVYLDQDIEREDYLTDKNKLVLEKRSLEEQIATLEQNQNSWLEPLKNFTKIAQTLSQITPDSSLLDKKTYAQKVFGSNLYLKNKKIESTPQKQWAALRAAKVSFLKNPECFNLVGPAGFEPATNGLKGHCSTN